MKAVIVKEPFNVKIEEIPTPQLEKPNDAIIKTSIAGLCGAHEPRSDLQAADIADSQALTFTFTAATSPDLTTSSSATKPLARSLPLERVLRLGSWETRSAFPSRPRVVSYTAEARRRE
jgi:hypothetical protein